MTTPDPQDPGDTGHAVDEARELHHDLKNLHHVLYAFGIGLIFTTAALTIALIGGH